MSHWLTVDDMTHIACTVDLQNVCIVDDELRADPVKCEDVKCKDVFAIILHEPSVRVVNDERLFNPAARIIQLQHSPALGIVNTETGVCVTICGFKLYQQDCVDYDDFKASVAKCNPCEIAEQLECCLLDIALDKQGKAGFSFRDTTVTFRKPDIPFIKSMLDDYRIKCTMSKNCGRPVSRRGRLGIC